MTDTPAMDEKETALIEKYAAACKRNAYEMKTMPMTAIRQHFKEFADELRDLAATAQDVPAVRNDEAGFIEFVNSDVPCVVREIDGKVAIILDMETRQVIGYRVYDPTASLKASQEAEVVTHRHLKSGHLVRVIGKGRMQADWWRVWIGPARDTFVTADMAEVVVYEHDGNLWVRPVEEFNDGRFGALATPQPSPDADGDAA